MSYPIGQFRSVQSRSQLRQYRANCALDSMSIMQSRLDSQSKMPSQVTYFNLASKNQVPRISRANFTTQKEFYGPVMKSKMNDKVYNSLDYATPVRTPAMQKLSYGAEEDAYGLPGNIDPICNQKRDSIYGSSSSRRDEKPEPNDSQDFFTKINGISIVGNNIKKGPRYLQDQLTTVKAQMEQLRAMRQAKNLLMTRVVNSHQTSACASTRSIRNIRNHSVISAAKSHRNKDFVIRKRSSKSTLYSSNQDTPNTMASERKFVRKTNFSSMLVHTFQKDQNEFTESRFLQKCKLQGRPKSTLIADKRAPSALDLNGQFQIYGTILKNKNQHQSDQEKKVQVSQFYDQKSKDSRYRLDQQTSSKEKKQIGVSFEDVNLDEFLDEGHTDLTNSVSDNNYEKGQTNQQIKKLVKNKAKSHLVNRQPTILELDSARSSEDDLKVDDSLDSESLRDKVKEKAEKQEFVKVTDENQRKNVRYDLKDTQDDSKCNHKSVSIYEEPVKRKAKRRLRVSQSECIISRQQTLQQENDIMFKLPHQCHVQNQRTQSNEPVSFDQKLKVLKKEQIIQQFDECLNQEEKKLPEPQKIQRLIFQFKNHSNCINDKIQQLSARLDPKNKKKQLPIKKIIQNVEDPDQAQERALSYKRRQSILESVKIRELVLNSGSQSDLRSGVESPYSKFTQSHKSSVQNQFLSIPEHQTKNESTSVILSPQKMNSFNPYQVHQSIQKKSKDCLLPSINMGQRTKNGFMKKQTLKKKKSIKFVQDQEQFEQNYKIEKLVKPVPLYDHQKNYEIIFQELKNTKYQHNEKIY